MNETVLSTRNLKRHYQIGNQKILALDDVNVNINKSDLVAIVGKSGSGKSTLMHLIGLLDTPSSGEILLNNINTTNLNEKETSQIRNSEIGFIFQSFNLLPRTTTLDNVLLPLQYSKIPQSEWFDRAVDMLKRVQLEDRMYNKSNELSGGQRQRVAIARALINEPTIILADEPTGNLDTKTGEIILETFFKLNSEGRTIVIVTHDTELADRLPVNIKLKDGKVVDKI